MPNTKTTPCKSDLIRPAERIITAASKEHNLTPIEIVTYESDTVRDDMDAADPVSGLVFRVNKNRDAEGISKLLDFIDNSCNVTAIEIRFSSRDTDTSNLEMDCLVGYKDHKKTVCLRRAKDEALREHFIVKLKDMFLESDVSVDERGFRTTGPNIKEQHWTLDGGASLGESSGFRRTPE